MPSFKALKRRFLKYKDAMTSIRTHSFYHHKDYTELLEKAKLVADYAVENKKDKKVLTTKYVKHIGLKSVIACQILRKYSRGKIKEAKHVNLIIPNQGLKYNKKPNVLYIPCLKQEFLWNPGRRIEKINQVEISSEKIYVSFTIKIEEPKVFKKKSIIGVDLNATHHVAVAANLNTGEVRMLGKQGPSIRKKYFKKRQAAQEAEDYETLNALSDREKRITKDLDHKISRDIVNFALETKSTVVLEDLKGIRKGHTKGKGSRPLNRLLNSWSFYRLRFYIEYKCQAAGVPCFAVDPRYTSQMCSWCGEIGEKGRKTFICHENECCQNGKVRHRDINAAYNIAKRHLKNSSLLQG